MGKDNIEIDDDFFRKKNQEEFTLPTYSPTRHYFDLTESGYFQALIVLRHYFKQASDDFFSNEIKAKNVDLFMLTPSISSPMGPGSDSEAIPIQFGKYKTNLVDSSQFGFEPLLLNGFDKVYCYLPSMRGENPDKRHLNQFYHCEAEIVGNINDIILIVENYIKYLSKKILKMPNILEKISLNYQETINALNEIIITKKFPEISFDYAVDILLENGYKNMVEFTDLGRDISASGELKIAEILDYKIPFWIRNYDRDRVPFYQKPCLEDSNKVINGDLIFPPLIKDAFGGEIVGCGQRQDSPQEMIDSLNRQDVNIKAYQWYVDLRSLPRYQITSGFGMGVERFITWALCRDDIKDAILYPRLKNIETLP